VRQFDLGQANRLIPFLSEAFEKVRVWAERAKSLTSELEALGDEAPIGAPVETPETDVGKLRLERDGVVEDIRREVSRISEMGIEVKSLDGLVDFRAIRDGRPVYLCWRFGEDAVHFWHELDTGFLGRRPIDRAEAFAPSYLS
jgi:hypothetical protein